MAQSNPDYTTNLVDFNGVGDGVTDNNAAITKAALQYDPFGVHVPPGIYNSTLEGNSVGGKFIGTGQIITTRSNFPFNVKHVAPPYRCVVNTPITTIGSGVPTTWRVASPNFPLPNDPNLEEGSTVALDISHILFPIGYNIVDSGSVPTLGKPTNDYLWVPEVSAFVIEYTNSSGWNNNTDSDEGRTGAAVFKTYLAQNGGGDLVFLNAEITVSGVKEGATHFLANSAGVFADADIVANNDGVYLNACEFHLSDSGYDCAGVGHVIQLDRTNNTGALDVTWIGERFQSIGSKPIDAFLSVSGISNIGLDLSTGNFGTNEAAIVLAPGQRIYFNGSNTDKDAFPSKTIPGTMWMEYDSKTLKMVVGNGTKRLFSVDQNGNAIFSGSVTSNGMP